MKAKSGFLYRYCFYYLRCLCCFPNRGRRKRRQKQKELQAKIENDTLIQSKNNEELRLRAAIKIQCVLRGMFARKYVKHVWEDAIDEANRFWLDRIKSINLELLRRRLELAARKQFVSRYVSDIIETSSVYISQTSEASAAIQRLWRGHRVRSMMPPKAPRRIRTRRPIPQVLKSRFNATTLRRVWSRRDFQPANGKWLHTTDFGHLEYDIWEHTYHPPIGNAHGLRTHKVKAVVRNERDKQILLSDKHAWVGLPIGIHTELDKELDAVAAQKPKTPYSPSVFKWKANGSNAKNISHNSNSNNTHQRNHTLIPVRHQEGSNTVTFSNDQFGTKIDIEDGGNDDPDSLFALSPSWQQQLHSGTAVANVDEHTATAGENLITYGSSFGLDHREINRNNNFDSTFPISGNGDRNTKKSAVGHIKMIGKMSAKERKIIAELQRLGFDPLTMDPVERSGVPKIGTLSYDSKTGRRIMHKGNNHWIGVNDKSFEVTTISYHNQDEQIKNDEENDSNYNDDDSDDDANSVHSSGSSFVKPTSSKKATQVSLKLKDLEPLPYHALSDYSGLVTYLSDEEEDDHHRGGNNNNNKKAGKTTARRNGAAMKKKNNRKNANTLNMTGDNTSTSIISGTTVSTATDAVDENVETKQQQPSVSYISSAPVYGRATYYRDDDDNVSEFNYVKNDNNISNSSHSSLKAKTAAAAYGQAHNLLSNTAASLSHSLSKYNINTTRNNVSTSQLNGSSSHAGVMTSVSYSAQGTPIRGARKPAAAILPLTPSITAAFGLTASPVKENNEAAAVAEGNVASTRNVLTRSSNTVATAPATEQLPHHTNSDVNANNNTSLKIGNRQNTVWGSKVKGGVEKIIATATTDSTVRKSLYKAASMSNTAVSALTPSSLYSTGSGSATTVHRFNEKNDLNFNNTRDKTMLSKLQENEESLNDDSDDEEDDDDDHTYDSDEEMWKSRSQYKPKKDVVAKVVMWPKASNQNYKLKYSWLPQPLLHNAVNNLYYQKTVQDFHALSKTRGSSTGKANIDFKRELLHNKARYQRKVEQLNMLSVVMEQNNNRYTGNTSYITGSGVDEDDTTSSSSKAAAADAILMSPMSSSFASPNRHQRFFSKVDDDDDSNRSPFLTVHSADNNNDDDKVGNNSQNSKQLRFSPKKQVRRGDNSLLARSLTNRQDMTDISSTESSTFSNNIAEDGDSHSNLISIDSSSSATSSKNVKLGKLVNGSQFSFSLLPSNEYDEETSSQQQRFKAEYLVHTPVSAATAAVANTNGAMLRVGGTSGSNSNLKRKNVISEKVDLAASVAVASSPTRKKKIEFATSSAHPVPEEVIVGSSFSPVNNKNNLHGGDDDAASILSCSIESLSSSVHIDAVGASSNNNNISTWSGPLSAAPTTTFYSAKSTSTAAAISSPKRGNALSKIGSTSSFFKSSNRSKELRFNDEIGFENDDDDEGNNYTNNNTVANGGGVKNSSSSMKENHFLSVSSRKKLQSAAVNTEQQQSTASGGFAEASISMSVKSSLSSSVFHSSFQFKIEGNDNAPRNKIIRKAPIPVTRSSNDANNNCNNSDSPAAAVTSSIPKIIRLLSPKFKLQASPSAVAAAAARRPAPPPMLNSNVTMVKAATTANTPSTVAISNLNSSNSAKGSSSVNLLLSPSKELSTNNNKNSSVDIMTTNSSGNGIDNINRNTSVKSPAKSLPPPSPHPYHWL